MCDGYVTIIDIERKDFLALGLPCLLPACSTHNTLRSCSTQSRFFLPSYFLTFSCLWILSNLFPQHVPALYICRYNRVGCSSHLDRTGICLSLPSWNYCIRFLKCGKANLNDAGKFLGHMQRPWDNKQELRHCLGDAPGFACFQKVFQEHQLCMIVVSWQQGSWINWDVLLYFRCPGWLETYLPSSCSTDR